LTKTFIFAIIRVEVRKNACNYFVSNRSPHSFSCCRGLRNMGHGFPLLPLGDSQLPKWGVGGVYDGTDHRVREDLGNYSSVDRDKASPTRRTQGGDEGNYGERRSPPARATSLLVSQRWGRSQKLPPTKKIMVLPGEPAEPSKKRVLEGRALRKASLSFVIFI
jgi:hypothetical protein